MAGYIGSKASVTQVDGYNTTEADAEFLNQTEGDARYVELAGDTLTGALTGTDLTLSGGVYLGGTGSANKLDDYEEGTWTPKHSSNTMTNVRANYVKIGRVVHLSLDATAPSGSTTTNAIGGLPFNAINEHAAVYVGYTNASSAAAGGYTDVNLIRLIQNGSTSQGTLAAGERVILGVTYYTDL